MSITPEVFMNDWTAEEFYLLIQFHSWEAHSQNEYSKLMSLKASAKH